MSAAVEQTEIDRIVEGALEFWGIPGASIVVVQGDAVVACGGYGVRHLETGEPVTPDTLFAIASVTKAFTTCALAMLVDEGKLAWDDPVRKHLEWFRLSDPLADANVTVRDLVTHRTGLSRHDMLWYKSPWTREEIVRKCGLVALTKSFRSTYQYNNNMFVAAGLVLQAITGGTWDDFIQQRIFSPLGMATADCSSTIARTKADYATPHRKRGDEPIAPIEWLEFDSEGPGGTINASAREMGAWLRLQLGNGEVDGKRLVSEENLLETRTPQMVIRTDPAEKAVLELSGTTQQTYGMGWTIWDYRGHSSHSHGGAIDGFRSTLALAPREKLGIVVLVNGGPTNAQTAIRNLLMDRFLGLEPLDWNALLKPSFDKALADEREKERARAAKRQTDTRPSHPGADYVGDYANTAYGTATVEATGAGLTLSWSRFTVPLQHWHHDTFLLKDEDAGVDELVRFALDVDGKVAELTLIGQAFTRRAS
ncbi:MAG: estB 5 [Armatimonadetes bacterium]|nr:estB 5 [Armatimonadota bacterium]